MVRIAIILASKSERRINILKNFIQNLIIEESDYIEKFDNKFDIITNSMSISRNKASSISNKCPEDTVIGADTIVVKDNKILGKPKDRDEAYQFLSNLSNSTHEVITSYCIINRNSNIEVCDYVTSYVKFINLNDNMINSYLDTNEWTDKAGAYGIQGIASLFVENIDGDYWSIVGLPISHIYQDLRKYFNINLIGEKDDL